MTRNLVSIRVENISQRASENDFKRLLSSLKIVYQRVFLCICRDSREQYAHISLEERHVRNALAMLDQKLWMKSKLTVKLRESREGSKSPEGSSTSNQTTGSPSETGSKKEQRFNLKIFNFPQGTTESELRDALPGILIDGIKEVRRGSSDQSGELVVEASLKDPEGFVHTEFRKFALFMNKMGEVRYLQYILM